MPALDIDSDEAFARRAYPRILASMMADLDYLRECIAEQNAVGIRNFRAEIALIARGVMLQPRVYKYTSIQDDARHALAVADHMIDAA